MALLGDTFERVQERGRAHLVTLLGEPGIGKSRVVEEFLGTLPEGVKVLSGRSSPFEEEVTFWPLAQMVYREIGEERDAPEERVLERLREIVAGWVEPDEVDRAVRRLGFTLGLGEEGSQENRYHAAEVRSGILAMLTGLASGGPVVLVFEDLHEADPLLLDLIEQLAKEARKVPLMMVCVARWEFLEQRPNWAGGLADAVTLWVEPLTLAHATELALMTGDLAHRRRRARRPARGREPVLHRGDHRHAPPRRAAAPDLGVGSHLAGADAARHRPGGGRGAHRPADAAGARARAARERLPARPLRPRRAVPPGGAAQGAAGRGGGGGAPRARRGTAQRLALRQRRVARRRVRLARQARAPAAAPARGEQALRGGAGPVSAHDRVPSRAGGPRGPRPQPARPDARRARGRGPGARGGPGADAHRVPLRRRPLRARARPVRPAGHVG